MSEYVRVTLSLPNGKRKYYSGATRKEAEAKRDADKLRLLGGVDIGNKSTFAEVEYMWFNLYKKDQLHKRSEETIRFTMDKYVLPVLGKIKVTDVKPLDIQRLMRSVSKYSLSTQKKVIQMTKSVFNVAVENGLIPRNPVTSSVKASAPKPEEVKALTSDQCKQLLDNAKGKRGYTLVVLLLTCGLRRGEVLGLMWKDIDFERKTLDVRRSIIYPNENKRGEISTELKTKASRRTIPLREDVLAILKAEKKKSESVWVFSMTKGENKGSFLSESSFRKLWDAAINGLPFDVHPHQLRHTFVTILFENGLDIKQVQNLAGHANPQITMAIYTHYREEQRRDQTAEQVRNSMSSFAI